ILINWNGVHTFQFMIRAGQQPTSEKFLTSKMFMTTKKSRRKAGAKTKRSKSNRFTMQHGALDGTSSSSS
uniref:Uncharacterized protein n=1 Tax=Scleropages formosus TaxID=113540 RepID=A0A8C9R1Z2_SCLFO